MSRATNAEEDLRRTYWFVRLLVSMLGAWPNSSKSSSIRKLLRIFHILATYFFLLLILIPTILHMTLNVRNGRIRIKMMPPLVNGTCQLMKYSIILYRQKEFRTILNEIKEDWLAATDENRLILRAKLMIGRKGVMLISFFMYGGGVCYRTFLPLSKGRIVLPNNMTMRLLPCAGYFGVNEQLTPNYEIIFALQIVAGLVLYTLVCGSIAIPTFFCLHAASLLKILMNKMIELSETADVTEESVQKRIAEIVDYQTRIKCFLGNVEVITQYICSFDVVNCSLNTCIVGYCLIMEWENSNFGAILVYLTFQALCVMNIFIICYAGQDLLNESNNVKETATTLSWYRFSVSEARCLILIINTSNYPIKLTAAKIVDLSFATFTDIMKMSMGYLNMLRAVV